MNVSGQHDSARGISANEHQRLEPTQKQRQSILVIDDDIGTLETFRAALELEGLHVVTVRLPAEALAIVRREEFDLFIIDLRVGATSGLDIVRAFRTARRRMRFVLISAFLDVRTTVEAMKLGAFDVVEKPIDLNQLFAIVSSALEEEWSQAGSPVRDVGLRTTLANRQPRSAAERWAMRVLQGAESEGDPRTIQEWKKIIAVSYSSLCESCRLIGVSPHDARDFMRVLRAVLQAPRHDCAPEVLLDVSDRRTLKELCFRAGFDLACPVDSTLLSRFLEHQRFIPHDNEGLKVLIVLLLGTASMPFS